MEREIEGEDEPRLDEKRAGVCDFEQMTRKVQKISRNVQKSEEDLVCEKVSPANVNDDVTQPSQLLSVAWASCQEGGGA
jgi:hypothetical protein